MLYLVIIVIKNGRSTRWGGCSTNKNNWNWAKCGSTKKKFDEDKLEELASSIKRYGVIQPIIVMPKDGYYQIVAGERRWRAAKRPGLQKCLV